MTDANDAVPTGWLYLEHEETGGRASIPNDPAVLTAQQARGWRLADPPDTSGPFIPAKVNVHPEDLEAQWVEFVHPVTGARHQWPNNPDALQGAAEAGWVIPNRDGSIPKRALTKAAREQGVAVDDLPAAAGESTEEPVGDADAESDEQAGDSTATDTKEG